jgi:Protein of unknown function (DUF3140)
MPRTQLLPILLKIVFSCKYMLAVKRLQQLGVQFKLLSTPVALKAKFSNMAHLTTNAPSSKCSKIFTKHLPEGIDPRQVVKEFMATVNMQPNEIEDFLTTEESRKAADLTDNEEEQDGRHLARRICELLEKVGERKEDPHAYELSLLYEADLQQMYQVTDYVRCHLEELRGGREMDPLWRFRLMNCGYDPMKDEQTRVVAERQEK